MKINKVNPRTTRETARRLTRALRLAKLKNKLTHNFKHKIIKKNTTINNHQQKENQDKENNINDSRYYANHIQ